MAKLESIRINLYLPGDVWILSITAAIWSLGSSIASPFQSLFFKGLGTPIVYIGAFTAISSLVTIIAYILGGYIADVSGRRKVIVVFSVVSALSAFFFVFVNTWFFLLVPIIIGAFSGIYNPAFNAMMNDSMRPKMRAVGFASFAIVSTLPSIFAPYIGGNLIQSFGIVNGMKIAFFLSGMFGAAAVYIRARYLKETYKPVPAEKKELGRVMAETLRGYLDVMMNSKVQAKKLLAYAAASSVAAGLSTVFISIYLIERIHVAPNQYGFLVGISALATNLLLLPAISAMKRMSIKKIAVFSALSSPASMLIFISATGMNDLMAWSITGGVSGTLLSSVIQGLEGNATGKEVRGRFIALFNIISLACAIPAQLLSGFLYTISPLSTFLLSIPFYAASVLILISI
ncbi:MAG: MFS transporter [Candidatus Micrarchaeota archaeon]|nr:MFS transporter [Candidatus Micrarchaeota archaeon]MDE1850159.1 MFS transporter [Candidatus Micrarchaeota archaeon]